MDANPATAIRILGVNGAGFESGNELIVEGNDIPWLQDTPEENAWTRWQVTYRDVVVLDRANRVVAVFNLTEHDLARPDDYAALRALLLATAGE